MVLEGFILAVVQGAITLGAAIILHEAGHMMAAKIHRVPFVFRITVKELSINFEDSKGYRSILIWGVAVGTIPILVLATINVYAAAVCSLLYVVGCGFDIRTIAELGEAKE